MGNLISSTSSSPEDQAGIHRAKADSLAARHNSLIQQSQEAYRSGNGAHAKELSLEAKEVHKQMDAENKAAAALYFKHHNKDIPEDTVDLHGLFVKEAIQKLDETVNRSKREGRHELVIIVGAGNHSAGGVPRIRPAVEAWLRDHGHSYSVLTPGALKAQLKHTSWSCTVM